MSVKSKVITVGTTVVVITSGAVITAPTALATAPGCVSGYVCLYAGANLTGSYEEIISQSSLTSGNYVPLVHNVHRSSSNNTAYKLCTYSAALAVTNILLPNTAGNLANVYSDYVKRC
jgi:tetrahydromethanopterin S-methyltransferase subunit D